MKEIFQLDSATIDKIAAGEVVERPLSVVKELVENSIDAGADAITVEIKDGGISYIRITDNGEGIARNQVRNALKRHATSKIKSVEDLLSVSSLGFRGEALSSISSVSRIEILTKTKDDIVGTRYVVEGGKEMILDDVGVPEGTSIIVKDLFFNTPARRKFLKSPQTEASYISELIEHLMLSNPYISFKLIIKDSVKLQSPGNGNVLDVIYNIYGKDIAKNLIKVDADNGDIHISGYVGKPEISRGNKNFEIYFVNNRIISSSLIARALDEAYKNYLMLHKYPVVFLNLDMPGFMVDVNVHPAKKEVRFIEGDYLYTFLANTVKDAIRNAELIPEINTKDNEPKEEKTSEKIYTPEPFEIKRREVSFNFNENSNNNAYANAKDLSYQEENNNTALSKEISPVFEVKDKSEYEIKDEKHEQMTLFSSPFLSEEALKKHKIIGQLFNTYWLLEYDNNLYIVDQHAAHEKVKYERLIKMIKRNEVSSQLISPPIIISLSSLEEEVLNKYKDNFMAIGYDVDYFGGHEYSINAVPLELFSMDPKEYFLEMLDDIANGIIYKNNKIDNDAINLHIATMACKSAVKGNMKMTEREADELISELLTLDNPYNCPHGRPTIVSYSKTDIEKMFKRIVN